MQKTVVMNGNLPTQNPKAGGTLPLAMASAGDTVQIYSIRGRDDTRRYLEGLGFVEGGSVCVVSEISGNLIVEVKGARIALDKSMALRVMVA